MTHQKIQKQCHTVQIINAKEERGEFSGTTTGKKDSEVQVELEPGTEAEF